MCVYHFHSPFDYFIMYGKFSQRNEKFFNVLWQVILIFSIIGIQKEIFESGNSVCHRLQHRRRFMANLNVSTNEVEDFLCEGGMMAIFELFSSFRHPEWKITCLRRLTWVFQACNSHFARATVCKIASNPSSKTGTHVTIKWFPRLMHSTQFHFRIAVLASENTFLPFWS